jgi:energy-coupling factor transporter ATP-binding protein EcfA2
MSIVDDLREIAERVQREFEQGRRLLSFQEYLELFGSDPLRHSRDAAWYLRDAFDHYGRETVERPWGKLTRFRLFDLPFLEPHEARRESLIGQEAVQGEIYRALSNFVREGRPNRVVLLHGPNGSAKSTVAACIMRALEHYSTQDEGSLYRFHWVFPNEKTVRGAIGFGGKRSSPVLSREESYAHLPEEDIDARLFIEVRDHPLFLLPRTERKRLLERMYADAGSKEPPPSWVLRGELSAQESSGVRGAAQHLRRVVRAGAAARPGRTLLHFAALPRRRRLARAAALGGRRRTPDHRRS